MTLPAVTNTFSNASTADASQVNTNFTDIINALTDATKSLSIDALTCAGTATLNGAINLGNATGDDITVTGSLASSIPIKTTNTYDIGATALGLRALYLASSDSAAYGVKLVSPVIASALKTFTFPNFSWTSPTADGQVGDFLTTDGSGAMSFSQSKAFRAVTGTDSTTAADQFITCTNSYTQTLHTAVGSSGRKIKFVNIGTGTVTFATTSSQTMSGVASTAVKMTTQYDWIEFKSDNANWIITSRGNGLASYVRVNTGGGFGSTNTKIRRFTTTVTATGGAITYADSAGNGGSFTINETGLYSGHFSNDANGTVDLNDRFGFSLNSNQLTTDFDSITTADRLSIACVGDAAGMLTQNAVFVGRLAAGDVLRAHCDGTGANSAYCSVTIARLGGCL